MFKKVVFSQKVIQKANIHKIPEWLITCSDNFFFFSTQKLELNCWYEIIYYQGNSGVFRLKTARLLGLGKQLLNITQNIQNIQNIYMLIKCSESCIISNCFECKVKQTTSKLEYQKLLQERAEYEKARNTFNIQSKELTSGYLYLNGKDIEWFATKNEAEKWQATIKKGIQWSFANLEISRKLEVEK